MLPLPSFVASWGNRKKRLPGGICSLIICGDGKPALGSTATGGGLHAKMRWIMADVLDFGMDWHTAADIPAFVGWEVGPVEEEIFDPKISRNSMKWD